MTSSKNTNDPRRDETNTSPSSQNKNHNYDPNFEANWSAFMTEYADDLDDVVRSRIAKNFEKRVKKELKKQLEKESEIKESSETSKKDKKNKFTLKNLSSKKSYIAPQSIKDSHVRFVTPSGPRDNTRSSWLDLDNTMEDYGEDFVPPNPTFENISLINVVLWIIFILGIAGIISSAFLPSLATIIGTISGVFILIGGAGLFMNRKKPDPYKEDYRDYGDGARV